MNAPPTWNLEGEPSHIKAKNLKAHLFDAYGGFSDKRIKNLDKSCYFIADDRDTPRSHAADGSLFLWFCTIVVEVIDQQTVRIVLGGAPPMSDSVHEWVSEHAELSSGHGQEKHITITLGLGDEARLRELADRMRAIVRLGARYPVPAYKFVCPRTADSLCRLADVLADAPRE